MALKIEKGKYYRTRDGRKVGPMGKPDRKGVAKFPTTHDNEIACWPDGRIKFNREACGGDLIAEWTDKPVGPKLWRHMTPEEKGERLLAYWGEGIEASVDAKTWYPAAPNPNQNEDPFPANLYVRIRTPRSKRETVSLYCDDTKSKGNIQCIGTIDLVDGKPDLNSILKYELRYEQY